MFFERAHALDLHNIQFGVFSTFTDSCDVSSLFELPVELKILFCEGEGEGVENMMNDKFRCLANLFF